MKRILIIDDDPEYHDLLGDFFKILGCECSFLLEGSKTIEVIRDFKPDLVVLDILMPGLTGRTIYDAVREEFGYCIPVIICSGTNMTFKKLKDDLIAYCPKPVNLKQMEDEVNRLIEMAAECRVREIDESDLD